MKNAKSFRILVTEVNAILEREEESGGTLGSPAEYAFVYGRMVGGAGAEEVIVQLCAKRRGNNAATHSEICGDAECPGCLCGTCRVPACVGCGL